VDELILIDASVYAEGTGEFAKLPKLLAYVVAYVGNFIGDEWNSSMAYMKGSCVGAWLPTLETRLFLSADSIKQTLLILKQIPGRATGHSQDYVMQFVVPLKPVMDSLLVRTIFSRQMVHLMMQLLIRSKNDGILWPISQYTLYSASIALPGGTLVKSAKSKGVSVRALVVINPLWPVAYEKPIMVDNNVYIYSCMLPNLSSNIVTHKNIIPSTHTMILSIAIKDFISFCLVTVQSSVDSESQIQNEFKKWIVKHGRVYKDEDEKAVRFATFRDTWLQIEAFNAGPDRGYILGVNGFSDGELTPSVCSRNSEINSIKYVRRFDDHLTITVLFHVNNSNNHMIIKPSYVFIGAYFNIP
ncbi:alanine aminotransferase 2, partial [Striga asiatica]